MATLIGTSDSISNELVVSGARFQAGVTVIECRMYAVIFRCCPTPVPCHDDCLKIRRRYHQAVKSPKVTVVDVAAVGVPR